MRQQNKHIVFSQIVSEARGNERIRLYLTSANVLGGGLPAFPVDMEGHLVCRFEVYGSYPNLTFFV